MEAPRLRLVSTRLSPAPEIMRWLLEIRGISYAEEAHAPAFHVLVSQRHRVPPELPLVLGPEGISSGIRQCLDALDEKCRKGETVYGEDDRTRRETKEAIDVFHSKLFLPAIQIYYFHMLDERRLILDFSLDRAPWWQRLLVQLFYPVWKRVIISGLKLQNFDIKVALANIEDAFVFVEQRITPSQPFLHGATPGTADIVFASLAAPLLLPERYGAKLPDVHNLPRPLRDLVNAFRARRGGQFVDLVYRQARPVPQPPQMLPRRDRSLLSLILTPKVLLIGARLLARLAPRLSVRKRFLVASWRDVCEVLERDNDFHIGPINKDRIEGVSGPFILGMDRKPVLFAQRELIYGALRNADPAPARAVLRDEPGRLLAAAASRHGRIDVVNGYARLVAARTAVAVFGIKGPTEQDFMRVIRAIFHETFLNIGNDPEVRTVGRAAGRELTQWIHDEMARRRSAGQLGSDVLGRLMESQPASSLEPDHISWMLAGLLVGSIDTTATAVSNIVAEMLADDATAQSMLTDIDDNRRFLGWCYELLRRRPHNPILLRRTEAEVRFGDKTIAPETTVVAVTIAGMQDSGAFPQPAAAIPTRPLGNYLHFGHGLHLCSGRNLNDIQIPVLVRELLRNGASAISKPRSRGPFPDEFIVGLWGSGR